MQSFSLTLSESFFISFLFVPFCILLLLFPVGLIGPTEAFAFNVLALALSNGILPLRLLLVSIAESSIPIVCSFEPIIYSIVGRSPFPFISTSSIAYTLKHILYFSKNSISSFVRYSILCSKLSSISIFGSLLSVLYILVL